MEENPSTATTSVDIESLWVESATGIIHTVKFLGEEFALARALSPALYHFVRRIPVAKFVGMFEAFEGNYDEVRDLLNGGDVIVTAFKDN